MEKERKKLDKQLDHALEKSKAANHGQEVLETKIKVSIIAIGPSFFIHIIFELWYFYIYIEILSDYFRYKSKKLTRN